MVSEPFSPFHDHCGAKAILSYPLPVMPSVRTIIKQRFPQFYAAVKVLTQNSRGPKLIPNYFKTDFNKNSLFSAGVVWPFTGTSQESLHHTNGREMLAIAQTLKDLGYNVDIVEYDCRRDINYDNYDLIIGGGFPFTNSFSKLNKKTTTVYYSSGHEAFHDSLAGFRRMAENYSRTGKYFWDSMRFNYRGLTEIMTQEFLADAVITLGNQSNVDSYKKVAPRQVYNLPLFYFKVLDPEKIIQARDISQAKKHFLYFSGGGLVHKGLDLVLEAFRDLPDLHLHVCASIDSGMEAEFKKYYQHLLYQTPNIHTHGFVALDSPNFSQMLQTCAYLIFPSCSEGGAGSVVNVLGNGGLVPILTKGIVIDQADFTVDIGDLTVAGVKAAAQKAAALPDTEILSKSKQCAAAIIKRHSLENYSLLLKNYLREIIAQSQKT